MLFSDGIYSVTRLQVHFDKLQFTLGDVEPFFCNGALYDLSQKKRVSETWSFDGNSQNTLKLLGSRIVRCLVENNTRNDINFHLGTTIGNIFKNSII